MTTRPAPTAQPHHDQSPNADHFHEIAASIETWYSGAKRDLPWRRRARNADERAWRCLVAESMLQQTQVSRVVDRFQIFIARFPTPESLAAADEQEVLALWQGLGYYRRARNLQAAARMIVEHFGGRTPRNLDDLLRLPGVGRYTAGAIASIAFGARTPIVDGNVSRVVCRLRAIEDRPVDHPRTQSRIWSIADALVQACANPAEFNQALMELGSLVCAPRSANCGACPVVEHCAARRLDRVHAIPVAKSQAARRTVHFATVPIHRRGRWLLVKRPARGLWGSLWQSPTIETTEPADIEALRDALAAQHGITTDAVTFINSFVHQTSHREVRFAVYRAIAARGRARGGAVWAPETELHDWPVSNAQRRVFAMFAAGDA